jgi:hypothetical protein
MEHRLTGVEKLVALVTAAMVGYLALRFLGIV